MADGQRGLLDKEFVEAWRRESGGLHQLYFVHQDDVLALIERMLEGDREAAFLAHACERWFDVIGTSPNNLCLTCDEKVSTKKEQLPAAYLIMAPGAELSASVGAMFVLCQHCGRHGTREEMIARAMAVLKRQWRDLRVLPSPVAGSKARQ